MADRTRYDDWEGGLIVGAEGRSAIGTLVDRASRYLLLDHLPVNRSADENTNGLLRQYFPKRTNLSIHTRPTVAPSKNRLNNRPRKSLGWRTPAEWFFGSRP